MMSGLALLGGAVAGSAAGAAMQRWPDGLTLSEPRRSRCSACEAVLRPRDLVPIVSWIALRGRCAACGHRIDPRLPLVEAAGAIIAVLIVRTHGATSTALIIAAGAVGVIVAALIDVERRIIPDRLTLPLACLGVATIPLTASGQVALTAAWALGVPLALHAVNVLADAWGRPRPVGAGDVKFLVGVLAISGSAPMGPQAVLLGTIIAGGSFAAVGLLVGHLARRSRVPLAPAIAAAYLVVAVAPERAAVLVELSGGGAWLG